MSPTQRKAASNSGNDSDRTTIAERDFVQSLARGLSVIRAFGNGAPSMSLAEIAAAADVSRPSARRLLLTLQSLGYVRSGNGRFSLAPRILTLGQAFLSSQTLVEVAQPHMQHVTATTGESCAIAALDGDEVVYLSRVAADRIMSSVLVVGSRLPAYATSLGRVLLADVGEAEFRSALDRGRLAKLTEHTETDVRKLAQELKRVHRQGYSIVDQEMEEGLRSAAVPIRDYSGKTVAALGSSCHASRVSLQSLRKEHLPLLLTAAERLSEALGYELSSES